MISFFLITGCSKDDPPVPGTEPVEQPGWIVGADISLLSRLRAAGAVYKNSDGMDVDVLPYFREKGFNYVRVRLFVNPDLQSSACQDLPYVQDLILKAKEKGYYVLLNFHYSDTWADPGKQYKPVVWGHLGAEALAEKVYGYTKETLATLAKNGAAPQMIQIGNEITNGMLWDSARADVWSQEWDTPGRWTYFCRVLSQASRACREVCPNAWVMVHIDRGGDRETALRFFNRMEQYRVDYDVIGLSYYPFWHGPLSGLRACLSGLQMNFPGKKINMVEVAYPNNSWGIPDNASYIPDYPATPQGQAAFMKDFIDTLREFPNVNGFMYWYPEETYTPGRNVLTLHRGVFDIHTGRALEVINTFSE
jgi:arabinogalactan endo-1,4-beta-galactosidase